MDKPFSVRVFYVKPDDIQRNVAIVEASVYSI